MNLPFIIYRSSAGSGKTRQLVKSYLKLALPTGSAYFSHILAVTFTNKATQEMKERILSYLYNFVHAPTDDLLTELCEELAMTETQLRERSKELLSAILHRYSYFSVSTIDSFFQRVVRSFTREAGLSGDFELELDGYRVMRETLAELMEELGENKALTKWMTAFLRRQLIEGRSTDTIKGVETFGAEALKEDFPLLYQVDEAILTDDEKIKTLQREAASFESAMQKIALEALAKIKERGLSKEDFKYGDSGTALKYFLSFSKKTYYPSTGQRIQDALESGANWYSKKKADAAHIAFTDSCLVPLLRNMVDYQTQRGRAYQSVLCVLKDFYAFALTADIMRKLEAYRKKHNMLLISDIPRFISQIIRDSDVPFIYEKIGSYFHHYLIDEFQDTSALQWQNFYPLVKDALDQGYTCLVVGDVKQSIYRWRGGDPSLLQHEALRGLGDEQVSVRQLNTNYRSADAVVTFNNTLFSRAARTMDSLIGSSFCGEAFDGVEQRHNSRFSAPGYVHISFFKPPEHGHGAKSHTEQALKRLPTHIEELQAKGVKPADIAVLTRTKEEGQRVASALVEHAHRHPDSVYCYDVVSDESLRLDAAPSVRLLISALRYLHRPSDALVCARLAYEANPHKRPDAIFECVANQRMEELLPPEMIRRRAWMKSLSVYAITEELVRMFALGERKHEAPYLQGFQSVVLNFTARRHDSLPDFLTWWDEHGDAQSVRGQENAEAINIMTIHKAKGLQFRYVMAPFLSWKLDHIKNPLLWVSSSHRPFDKMGHLVVSYTKNLEDTFFEEPYRQERNKIHLDNLNLLYVAFTRAEEGLLAYAMEPVDKPDSSPTTVGDLIYQSIQEEPSLCAGLREGAFTAGELPSGEAPQPAPPASSIAWDSYIPSRQIEHIPVRETLSKPDEESSIQADINYGNLFHDILKEMRYGDEVEEALSRRLDSEPPDIVQRITAATRDALAHPIVKTWFDRKKWTVRTEVAILLPGGEQKRIDRLMTAGKHAVVADYKTGAPQLSDQAQVRHYMDILAQMDYRCAGYLVYLNPLKVVEVDPSSIP